MVDPYTLDKSLEVNGENFIAWKRVGSEVRKEKWEIRHVQVENKLDCDLGDKMTKKGHIICIVIHSIVLYVYSTIVDQHSALTLI